MQILSSDHSLPPLLSFTPEDQIANQAVLKGLTDYGGNLDRRLIEQIPIPALDERQIEALNGLLDETLEILGNHKEFPFKVVTSLREMLSWKMEALRAIKGTISEDDLPTFLMFDSAVNFYLPASYRQHIFEKVIGQGNFEKTPFAPAEWISSALKSQLNDYPANFYFEVVYKNCSLDDLEKVQAVVLEKLYKRSQEALNPLKAAARLAKLKAKILSKQCRANYLYPLLEKFDCESTNPLLAKTLFQVDAFYRRLIKDPGKIFSSFKMENISQKKAVFYHFYDTVSSGLKKLPSHRLSLCLDPLVKLKKEDISPRNCHVPTLQVFFNQAADLIHFPQNLYDKRSWPIYLSQISQNGRCRLPLAQEEALSVFIKSFPYKRVHFSEILIDHLKKESRLLDQDLNVILAFCYNMSVSLKKKRGSLYRKDIQEIWRYVFDYIDALEKFENKQCAPFFEKIQTIMRDPCFSFDDLHAFIHCLCYVFLNASPHKSLDKERGFAVQLTQSDGLEPHIQIRIYSETSPEKEKAFVTLLFPLEASQFFHLQNISKTRSKSLAILQEWIFQKEAPSFYPALSSLSPLKSFPQFQLAEIKKNIKSYLINADLDDQMGWYFIGSLLAQEGDASFWKESVLALAKKYSLHQFLEGFDFLLIMGQPFLLRQGKHSHMEALSKSFKENKSLENFYALLLEMMLHENKNIQETAVQLFFSFFRKFSLEMLLKSFPELFNTFAQQNRLHQMNALLTVLFENKPSLPALNCLLDYTLAYPLHQECHIRLIECLFRQIHPENKKQALKQNSFDLLKNKLIQLLEKLIKEHQSLILTKLFKVLLDSGFLKTHSSTAKLWYKLCLTIPQQESFGLIFCQHMMEAQNHQLWNFFNELQKEALLGRLKDFLAACGSRFQLEGQTAQGLCKTDLLTSFRKDFLENFFKQIEQCTEFEDWLEKSHAIQEMGLDAIWSLDFELLKRFLKIAEKAAQIPKSILFALETFVLKLNDTYKKNHFAQFLEGFIKLIGRKEIRQSLSEEVALKILQNEDLILEEASRILLDHFPVFLEWIAKLETLSRAIPFSFWQKLLLRTKENPSQFLFGLNYLAERYDSQECEQASDFTFTEALKEILHARQFDLRHSFLMKWIYKALYRSELALANQLQLSILKRGLEEGDVVSLKEWLMEYKPKQVKYAIEDIVKVIAGLFHKGYSDQALELFKVYQDAIIKHSANPSMIIKILQSERQFTLLAQFLLDLDLKEISASTLESLKDCLEALIRNTTVIFAKNLRIPKSFKPFTLACRLLMKYRQGDSLHWQEAYRYVMSSNNKSLRIQMLKLLFDHPDLSIPFEQMAYFCLCAVKSLENTGAEVLVGISANLSPFILNLSLPPYRGYAMKIVDSLLKGTLRFLLNNARFQKEAEIISDEVEKHLIDWPFLDLQKLLLYQIYFNLLSAKEDRIMRAATFLSFSFSNGRLDAENEKLALEAADYLFKSYSALDKTGFKNLQTLEMIISHLAEILLNEYKWMINPVNILQFLDQLKFLRLDRLLFKGAAIKIIFERRLPASPLLIEKACREILNSGSSYRTKFSRQCLSLPVRRDYIKDRYLNDKIDHILKSYPDNFMKRDLDRLINDAVIVLLLAVRSLSLYLKAPYQGRKVFSFKMMGYEKTALKNLVRLNLYSILFALGITFMMRLSAKPED